MNPLNLNKNRIDEYLWYYRQYYGSEFKAGQGLDEITDIISFYSKPGTWADLGGGTSSMIWLPAFNQIYKAYCIDKYPEALIEDYLNTVGTNEMKEIFSGRVFDFPKPMCLIKFLCSVSADKSSTVLDFFAGSGTTLHAVMQLNKEDGGRRQCILVTNNENNICREVTYERNKRVIEGYTTPKGVKVEGLKDNNLRYYRTRLLPRERTGRNMRALVAAATDLLCIKENLFEELRIKKEELRIGMTQRDVRLFSDGERAMLVIYNEEVIPEVVEWIGGQAAGLSDGRAARPPIKVYVFSPGAYAWDDDFAEVIDRVELCALPEAIYQAYKNVLPKKRERQETDEISPKQEGDLR